MGITFGDMAEALADLRKESPSIFTNFTEMEILERAKLNKDSQKE